MKPTELLQEAIYLLGTLQPEHCPEWLEGIGDCNKSECGFCRIQRCIDGLESAAPVVAPPPQAGADSFKEAIYGTFDDVSNLKSELVDIARELFNRGHTSLVTRIEGCAKQVDVVARHIAAKAVEDRDKEFTRLVDEEIRACEKTIQTPESQEPDVEASSHMIAAMKTVRKRLNPTV